MKKNSLQTVLLQSLIRQRLTENQQPPNQLMERQTQQLVLMGQSYYSRITRLVVDFLDQPRIQQLQQILILLHSTSQQISHLELVAVEAYLEPARQLLLPLPVAEEDSLEVAQIRPHQQQLQLVVVFLEVEPQLLQQLEGDYLVEELQNPQAGFLVEEPRQRHPQQPEEDYSAAEQLQELVWVNKISNNNNKV